MTVASAAPTPAAPTPAAPTGRLGMDPRTINAELLAGITNDAAGIARAEQIYNGLPEHYQNHAEAIGQILTQFRSVERIGLPAELAAADAWRQFSERFIRDGGRLDPTKGAIPAWMNDMATRYGPTILRLPGIDTIVSASDTVRSGYDSSRGFADGVGLPLRAMGAVFAQVQDTRQQVTNAFGEISPERARAFGIAYSAALYSQAAAPDSPTSANAERTREPNFFEQTIARVQSWASSLIHSTGGFGEFLMTVGNFVTNGFDWNKAKTDAQTTLAQERRDGVPTYESILARGNTERAANADRTADAAARPAAAEMMIAARNVAGIDTTQVVPVLRDGGVFRAGDGSNVIIRVGADGPESQVMTGPDGQPIDFAARSAGRWENVTNVLFGANNSEEYRNGALAGTAVAGGIGYMLRRPIIGTAGLAGRTVVGGFRAATAAVAGTASGLVEGVALGTGTRIGGAALIGEAGGVNALFNGATRALGGSAAPSTLAGTAVGTTARVGGRLLGRVAPVVGIGMSAWDAGTDIVNGVADHDLERVGSGATTIATVGGFAAAGAALGSAGFTLGPVGLVTAPAGALLGAAVGGVVDLGRRLFLWDPGSNREEAANDNNVPATNDNGAPQGNVVAAQDAARNVNRGNISFSGNAGPDGSMANVNTGNVRMPGLLVAAA